MPMEKQSKGALIALGIAVLLGLLWWGYRQWQHYQLARALHDPDPVVRIGAVRSAGKASQADILIEALNDEDPDIRFVAVHLLGRLGADTEQRVRALLEILQDDRPSVRREALNTLRSLPAGARPLLYRALEDEDPRIRAGSALALLRTPDTMIGRIPRPPGEGETIIPILTKLLDDEDAEVRQNAALALQELDWERGR